MTSGESDNGMADKGRNICIDATNQLTLQANKIQLGHVQPVKLKIFKLLQQGLT